MELHQVVQRISHLEEGCSCAYNHLPLLRHLSFVGSRIISKSDLLAQVLLSHAKKDFAKEKVHFEKKSALCIAVHTTAYHFSSIEVL